MTRQRLSPAWRLRATVAALVLAPAVHLVHMERLTRWVRWWATTLPSRAPVDHRSLAEWVDRVLGALPWPWRRTCLKRGLALYYLLATAGHPMVLHVGVRRASAGALEAHAWLTDGESPYLEPTSDVSSFTTISRFP